MTNFEWLIKKDTCIHAYSIVTSSTNRGQGNDANGLILDTLILNVNNVVLARVVLSTFSTVVVEKVSVLLMPLFY